MRVWDPGSANFSLFLVEEEEGGVWGGPEPGCRFKWWIRQRCRNTQDPLSGTHVGEKQLLELPQPGGEASRGQQAGSSTAAASLHRRKNSQNQPAVLLWGAVWRENRFLLDEIVRNRSVQPAVGRWKNTELGDVAGSNVCSPESPERYTRNILFA